MKISLRRFISLIPLLLWLGMSAAHAAVDTDSDGVPDIKGSVATGGYHSCAIDDEGLHCWGLNTSGQTTVPALNNPVMVTMTPVRWMPLACIAGGLAIGAKPRYLH